MTDTLPIDIPSVQVKNADTPAWPLAEVAARIGLANALAAVSPLLGDGVDSVIVSKFGETPFLGEAVLVAVDRKVLAKQFDDLRSHQTASLMEAYGVPSGKAHRVARALTSTGIVCNAGIERGRQNAENIIDETKRVVKHAADFGYAPDLDALDSALYPQVNA